MLVLLSQAAFATAKHRPWDRFDPTVAAALHAFRQTDHWIAEEMAINLDGNRLGRDNESGSAFNFDPSIHLRHVVTDLNGDGRLEVFLLFAWPGIVGNQQIPGVVMVRDGPTEWRIACDIDDWDIIGPRGGIRLLARRDHGWRRFRTSDGLYAWRRHPDGRMECEPRGPRPR
ncbi:hypothetical protein [Siccirubricoccus phaeus]|uniref:hypothetical protein n=1 Tax=Siccirubricoccus phaeus TaxID=2595053 RepID=UPI0011F0C3EF|nr:hypothetical protein [Siccirubricoccus phaeus]